MSSTHQEKSSDKPRQRNRKTSQRDQKPGRQRTPKPDQRDEDQIGSMIASTGAPAAAPVEEPLIGEVEPADVLVVEVAAADAPPADEVAAVHAPPIEPNVPADQNSPINIQTIANAYRDYTRTSFQVNRSFVEKLMGVRSFDKVIEVQTDYARQAYVNFVAESQKICELYGELAKQVFRPWKASRPG
jgi:hypothetical protein